MLHLPHVTELVRDDPGVGEERRRTQQNGHVHRVAVEPAEPREERVMTRATRAITTSRRSLLKNAAATVAAKLS